MQREKVIGEIRKLLEAKASDKAITRAMFNTDFTLEDYKNLYKADEDVNKVADSLIRAERCFLEALALLMQDYVVDTWSFEEAD